MMRRTAVVAVGACLLVGCTGTSPGARGVSDAAPAAGTGVTYADVARSHNERAERLSRLWARAAVQMRYTDGDGVRRREQGEGHLQVVQPGRLALSVGKIGEVLFWLGADEERFWWFELADASRASVARHENALLPCTRDIALPVHPLDLLDLLGITPIPATGSRAPVLTAGGRLVVDVPARVGARRVYFDRVSMLPVRVELWLPGESTPAVTADLAAYERVDLPGSPGVDPRCASRVTIEHLDTDAEVVLFLSDASDGSRFGRLTPAAFSFGELVGSLAPSAVTALDADCDRPAWPVPGR